MQSLPSIAIEETEAEIAALVRQLHKTQKQLHNLAGGEVDAFLLPDGRSYLLHDAQEKLRESETAQRSFAASQSSILNALPAHVALVDHESVILSVNDGWRSFAKINGLQSSSSGVGENYLEICSRAQDAEEAHGAAAGIRAVLGGTASEFSLDYACHSPVKQRWFQLRVNPLNNSESRGAVIMHVDITAMHLAEQLATRSQKRLRNLIDGLGPSMFVALLTPQGILVEINQPPLTAAGLKPEDVLGKPFAETPWWHSPEARQQLREAIVRAAHGEPSRYDVRTQGAGGQIIDIDFSLQPLRDETGEVIFLIPSASVITERKRAEAELLDMHKELIETSRQAGMAEVATAVLHNVGNVLNSVNISCAIISEKVRASRITTVAKAANLLQEHSGNLAAFLTDDAIGKKLPEFLEKLARRLVEEQTSVLEELGSLEANIAHIKSIVTIQQTHAKNRGGLREIISMEELVENALQMNYSHFRQHQIKVIRESSNVPPVCVDKHKVLQIFVNLIRNAIQAVAGSNRSDKEILVRIGRNENHVQVSVCDNGIGIARENLTRIFAHGFTTKNDGHGFGLHSSVLAAKEMDGSLDAGSEGLGTGSTFTLQLPIK